MKKTLISIVCFIGLCATSAVPVLADSTVQVNPKTPTYYYYDLAWQNVSGKLKHIGWVAPTMPASDTTQGDYVQGTISPRGNVNGQPAVNKTQTTPAE